MVNNIIRRTWKQGGMVNIEDLRGSAFQAEDGGHTFLISGVDENGDALALSGTPAGVLLRADGQDVTLTCSVSDGVVSATMPANAYVVPGRVGITIFLTSGGQKTAIYAAVGSVATTSSGTVAPPAGADVVTLVNAIATAVATIPASYTDLMAAVAPTYSTSALYAVGNYAWYSGKLYRCTTAITSGETWTSAHWAQANLGSDVSDLKSAFKSIVGVELIEFESDGYISTASETVDINTITPSSTGYGYAIVPCTSGDVFLINGKGGNSPRLWAFINDEPTNNRISVSGGNATGTNLVLTAPLGSTKLILNSNQRGVCYKGRKNISNQIDVLRNSITDGIIISLNEDDMAAFIASKDHSSYEEGRFVTSVTSGYHVRIIRVRKGQWIKASLGKSGSINVLTYVQQDGTFIETIVQGGCYKYKYQVDRDGYIALCTNITGELNEVVLYSDSSNRYEEEYEIGWKYGYTAMSGDIDQQTHDFVYDAAYGLSNPVYLRYGDRITISALASSPVAVFCIYKIETNVWEKTQQGISASEYNTYTLTSTSGGMYVFISHKFAITDDEFAITIDRNHHAITSDFQTNNGVAFTNMNQYTKPGMYPCTSSTIIGRPHNSGGALLVVQHNNQYVAQYYYVYGLNKLMVRLLKTDGNPYNEWMELEPINPETNTFFGNRTGNKYIDLTSEFTSLDQFVKAPFFGQVFNTEISDLPMEKNGVLEVIPANAQYVLQRYYIYSKNITLQRFLGVNGTPYNGWTALGEPLYGKKILGVGDSLMAGNAIGNSSTWLNLLGTQYGAITYNYGKNGNPVANIDDTVGMVGRVPNIYNVDEITEIDYFVLIGGANDKRLGVPLGTDDSTTATDFCGALNNIISFVRQYWPKAHIVFLTNYDRFPNPNSMTGLSDIDYVEAMQRVCAKRHVFCYDNFHDSGVDFHDQYFAAWADEGIYRGNTANAHFSPEGYKWLLPKYKALLEAN